MLNMLSENFLCYYYRNPFYFCILEENRLVHRMVLFGIPLEVLDLIVITTILLLHWLLHWLHHCVSSSFFGKLQ